MVLVILLSRGRQKRAVGVMVFRMESRVHEPKFRGTIIIPGSEKDVGGRCYCQAIESFPLKSLSNVSNSNSRRGQGNQWEKMFPDF